MNGAQEIVISQSMSNMIAVWGDKDPGNNSLRMISERNDANKPNKIWKPKFHTLFWSNISCSIMKPLVPSLATRS